MLDSLISLPHSHHHPLFNLLPLRFLSRLFFTSRLSPDLPPQTRLTPILTRKTHLLSVLSFRAVENQIWLIDDVEMGVEIPRSDRPCHCIVERWL